MKQIIKYIVALIFISIGITVLTVYMLNQPNLVLGEKTSFKIKVGEEFSIRIEENGSTGFENCWRNENNCDNVLSCNKKYKNHLYTDNCEGCGGLLTWTFKGIKSGVDTILISLCPVGPMNQSCESFRLNSLVYLSNDSILMNKESYSVKDVNTYDYIISVEVEE